MSTSLNILRIDALESTLRADYTAESRQETVAYINPVKLDGLDSVLTGLARELAGSYV